MCSKGNGTTLSQPQRKQKDYTVTNMYIFLLNITIKQCTEYFGSHVQILAARPPILTDLWSSLVPTSKYHNKGLPQQAEVAQGVPGRLRPQTFLTFGTMRVVGRKPYTLAAFTPGEIPGTHFQRRVDPRAHGSVNSHRKNPQWHHRELIPGPSD